MESSTQSETKHPLGRYKQTEERGSGFIVELWDWIKSIAIALIVVVLLNQFVVTQSKVEGNSMQPTLADGQRMFVNRLTYQFASPHRGDVIIFKDIDPRLQQRDYLVKRVVAVHGDRVEIRSGQLYVNGIALAEPYTDMPIEDGDYGPFVVTPDHIFVLGDNRHENASRDSRFFGEIPVQSILGRASYIIWPLGDVKRLSSHA